MQQIASIIKLIGEVSSYNDKLYLLKKNENVTKYLSNEEIDSCFTLDYYFKEVGYIYKRLGLED